MHYNEGVQNLRKVIWKVCKVKAGHSLFQELSRFGNISKASETENPQTEGLQGHQEFTVYSVKEPDRSFGKGDREHFTQIKETQETHAVTLIHIRIHSADFIAKQYNQETVLIYSRNPQEKTVKSLEKSKDYLARLH